jgi:predicted transcriptional regulator
MYIDLARAYLADYGSQSELARALGISNAALSYILKPWDPMGTGRRYEPWGGSSELLVEDVSNALKQLKVPSNLRARQISQELCSDSERREALTHHMELARDRDPATFGGLEDPLAPDETAEVIRVIGEIHAVALQGFGAQDARVAYSQVWESARQVIRRIDPIGFPVEYAQILMFLHDAASVMNRHDLALQSAGQALLALKGTSARGSSEDYLERLRINAVLAQVVTLNNLGLPGDAQEVVIRAKGLPGYRIESEHWRRSLREQQLKSMASTPRISKILHAERVADEALALAGNRLSQQVGVQSHLLNVYTAHESMRKAARIMNQLAEVNENDLQPLYRIRMLRALARYRQAVGDCRSAEKLLLRGEGIALSADFVHQEEEIRRQASGKSG